VTTDQILLGVALILVLAVGSQVVAGRLRIPALIIMLPASFIVGALTRDVDPTRLLGASFQPFVSLAVAVILYDAGLGLSMSRLVRRFRAGSRVGTFAADGGLPPATTCCSS
jgi:NhaP-type Na+/H+ or K+/H+ antiporter